MTKELDCIIETGHYLFPTSSGVTELMLEYSPSSPSSSQPVEDPETIFRHMQRFPHSQQESQSVHGTEATQLVDVQHGTEATQLVDIQHGTETTQLVDVQHGTEATQLVDVQHGAEVTQLADIQRWNHVQIGDFVCKLGFLDMDKIGDKIKHFLHVNEVCVCVGL